MKWLKKLFSPHPRKPRGRSNERPDYAPLTNRPVEDENYGTNMDVLDGMEFMATLQIRTPLAVLEHHGEVYKGPPNTAPVYGTPGADGMWLHKIKSRPGIDSALRNLADGEHASDIGPARPSEYLPFLIAFRRIVESETPHKQQLAQLRRLPTDSREFADIWQRLNTYYDDFPESFFYMTLTSLPGVGRKTARCLYSAGFHSLESLRNATKAQLVAVPGVGSGTAEKILAVVNEIAD